MSSLNGLKVLVTGCCGFIGSHIVEELIREEAIVTGVDNLIRDNIKNIQGIRLHPNFTFVKGDIRNIELVEELCDEQDIVNHQAAVCIRYCQANPQDAIDINVKGTINVLEACANSSVKKIVAASSASVYGDPKELPIKESHPLLAKNLYGLTKIMNEDAYKYYAREHDLPFVAFRYMNVYGPRQNPDAFYTSVIPLFAKTILAGKAPAIMGDGLQTMDFVHVDDVVQANMLAMQDDKVKNEFFNVGTGTETSINQVCDTLLNILDSHPGMRPIHTEANKIDVNHRLSDITRISSMLGFKPKVSFEDGLRTVCLEAMQGKIL